MFPPIPQVLNRQATNTSRQKVTAMSTSDDQIRLNMLEMLYKRAQENPESAGIDRAIVQATLQIPEKQMDQNMSFLGEKALVELSGFGVSQWTFAKITGDGMDVIENKQKYKDKFSFTQAATSLTAEESQALPQQEEQPQFTFPEFLSNGFNQAYNQIRAENMSPGDRKKIEKQLNDFEKELLKTTKADLGTIQKDWQWLSKYAPSMCQILAPVVLEGIKAALNLP